MTKSRKKIMEQSKTKQYQDKKSDCVFVAKNNIFFKVHVKGKYRI